MKTINLKKGMFVYELGEQKLYETVDEVLAVSYTHLTLPTTPYV